MKKKTFDTVAFMGNRREELSREYPGLSARQIKERVQQEQKDDPPWQRNGQTPVPLSSEKRVVAVANISSDNLHGTFGSGRNPSLEL